MMRHLWVLAGLSALLILVNAAAVDARSKPRFVKDYQTEHKVYDMIAEADRLIDANKNLQAKEILTKCTQYDPCSNSGILHQRLSQVWIKLGNLRQGIVEGLIALKFDPELKASVLDVATAYKDLGQYDEATNWLTHYLTMPNVDKLWKQKIQDAIADVQQQRERESKVDPHLPDYVKQLSDENEVHPWLPERLPIRFCIKDGTGVPGYKPVFRQKALEAANVWMTAAGGKLAYTLVDDPSTAHLIIEWVGGALKPNEKQKFHSTAGLTHFDQVTNEKFFRLAKARIEVKTLRGAKNEEIPEEDIKATCLHEMGHALGLTGHSTNISDIMYYSDTSRRLAALTKRDKATIAKVYESYPIIADVRQYAPPSQQYANAGAQPQYPQGQPHYAAPAPYGQPYGQQPPYAGPAPYGQQPQYGAPSQYATQPYPGQYAGQPQYGQPQYAGPPQAWPQDQSGQQYWQGQPAPQQ